MCFCETSEISHHVNYPRSKLRAAAEDKAEQKEHPVLSALICHKRGQNVIRFCYDLRIHWFCTVSCFMCGFCFVVVVALGFVLNHAISIFCYRFFIIIYAFFHTAPSSNISVLCKTIYIQNRKNSSLVIQENSHSIFLLLLWKQLGTARGTKQEKSVSQKWTVFGLNFYHLKGNDNLH